MCGVFGNERETVCVRDEDYFNRIRKLFGVSLLWDVWILGKIWNHGLVSMNSKFWDAELYKWKVNS